MYIICEAWMKRYDVYEYILLEFWNTYNELKHGMEVLFVPEAGLILML